MSLLNKFIGFKLLSALIGSDTSCFEFECGKLATYNPINMKGGGDNLIGRSVKGVSYEFEKCLVIEFEEGHCIEVSLAPDDYEGPEAFCATFNDEMIVVE